MRVLLLRAGAIGDFVLTLPAIAALRGARPAARIVLIGHPRTNVLALAAGLVDEAISIDTADVARLFSGPDVLAPDFALFLASFDLAISWLSDKDRVVEANLRNAGIPRVITCAPIPPDGSNRNHGAQGPEAEAKAGTPNSVMAGSSALGVPPSGGPRHNYSCWPDSHAADHLFSPVRQLGMASQTFVCPRLELGPEHVRSGRDRLQTIGKRVVVVQPGSGSEKKNWPLSGFLELAARIEAEAGVTCAFSAGEADERIALRLRENPRVRLLPPMNLLELAQCLSVCAAYVGNDSGVTHLAAAVGCPVVALYGPTDPAVWGPRGANVRLVAAMDRAPDALRGVSVETVLAALRAALAERTLGACRGTAGTC